MATANPISVTPNPVPSGQSGTVSVTFTLDPGTPDITGVEIDVKNNGVVQQSATNVTLKGRPAETAPTVQVGKTGVGWEISTTAGTLTPGQTANTFLLHS